jgi:acetyl esterase
MSSGRALDLFWNLAARGADLLPRTRRLMKTTERVAHNVAYLPSGRSDHTLDVFRPKATSGTLPVVLYIHGGGFRILSKDSHHTIARRFAMAGYTVVNINYRLVPDGAFPNALEDTCAALKWTLDHVADYGGDPTSLAFAGESAGGNLSLALALCCVWERPEPYAQQVFERGVRPFAVLPACGLLEVHNAARYLQDESIPKWIRQRMEIICEGYLGTEKAADLASPLRLIEDAAGPQGALPPLLAICGTTDPLLADTLRLGAAIKAHGLEGAIKTYEGVHHAFHAFPGKQSDKAWTDQLEFLQRCRSLSGAP